MLAYFKLVRLPILVLIAAMQYATRYFIIEPMLSINGYGLIMTNIEFFYLVLSSVLIAAGGYAINDYFDVKIDRMNKPRIVVVDRLVKRRVAMAMHIALSAAGLLLASYLSWKAGLWKMIPLFLLAIFALWFYSTNLKNQFLTGNLTIAVLAGFVPLIVGLYEIPLQNAAHPEVIEALGYSLFNIPAYWIMGYALVIAVLTLAREITKDVIDIKGDRYFGCRTVPIVMGIKKTKSLLIATYTLFALVLIYLYLKTEGDFAKTPVILVYYQLLFVVLLISVVSQFILIFRARTKRHFLYSANLNNGITLLVLLSTLFIKLSINAYFA